MKSVETLQVWGVCTDCGYEGLIDYRHLEDEAYDDDDALGVMLLQCCPACDSIDHSLLPLDYYRELLTRAEADGED